MIMQMMNLVKCPQAANGVRKRSALISATSHGLAVGLSVYVEQGKVNVQGVAKASDIGAAVKKMK